MANLEIREAAKAAGVHLWQIAAAWPCTDSNFSRKLRREFSEADRLRALAIVSELSKEVMEDD